MSFDTKKMIIAIIIVAILFILFLGYAFNNIQKVELEIRLIDISVLDAELETSANEIVDKYNVEYVDNLSLNTIDMNILLVNHQTKSACLVKGQEIFAVDYGKLDKSIIYCNSYVALADGQKTLIINCDEILGNPIARTISNAYHYEYTNTSNLSPESVECFQTISQNESISFYKYQMIESAKESLFNDEKLDNFYYFYDQWAYFEGLNGYQEVINYDYYDGFKAYVYSKAMEDIDDSFVLEEYIDSFKNAHGIYSKDSENAVMGLLWCLLMEKQGRNVIIDEDRITDMYKMLLEGVPQGQVDDSDMRSEYHEKFIHYIENIDEIISEYKADMNDIEPIMPVKTAETYKGTIKVKDNHYIYINYRVRTDDNTILQQGYLTAEVSPYNIKLYFK